jgi:hypothetical protein
MDGIEPPYRVLQTRASPLGHTTRTECNDTANILVYKYSRLIYLIVDKLCSIEGSKKIDCRMEAEFLKFVF